MSAAETAEVFFIVVKRLLKWALWIFIGLLFLGSAAWGIAWGKQYFEKKPYQAIRYADLTLGDPQKEVIYAMGPPSQYLMPPQPPPPGTPKMFWDEDKMVRGTDESYSTGETYRDSTEWIYPQDQHRLEVEFDKPGGMLARITCYSSSQFRCPVLYGLRDGSHEDEVIAHLGRPVSEQMNDVTKTMRYPQYNLTLYLNKRRVYMLRLSTNATL